ncbi:adenosine 3'-phospho 5'-phosphosulfate transporter 1 isoform X2 [Parasteatoda tepidariorum]|uniref:adenosine 3'-phospho 5'-phosphosulfate transporter 1 isoform X2 n=1 Tax=Parasteatoda tepidariorum TaxID=114398 RepID=UPI00077F88FA|nr:adenosine 3'-phospho 5'-phosphosulfate transporter 1 isoform X2 [Parasteatoda tepidariorum]
MEWTESWILRLVKNLLGYTTVAVPGALLVYYSKKSKYLDNTDSCWARYVKLFVHGEEETRSSSEIPISKPKHTNLQKAFTILFCFLGLQLSYLTWGLIQEKIMTQNYHNALGEQAKFTDSQFLVFVNRFLAFIFAGTYVSLSSQPKHVAPLYKYSYCSFSNIMSSWLQYEALKYVSFPTQVLAKASKIIPVMVMGKIISKKGYKYHEYATAIAISIGSAIFLLSGKKSSDIATTTTVSGLAILVGYIVSDSFTSNWQSALFKQYHMSSMQMMCGVNFFSCIFTSISLLQQGGFFTSFLFFIKFSSFLWDCLLLSVCSTIGQLFIFYTISEFGAVIFVIIMTIRQIIAILLSCFIYHHPLTLSRIFGVLIVFTTVFLRIYLNHRTKKPAPSPATVQESTTKA